ncbi:hypothetical protein AB0P17_06430 [Streptomyces sp. NPDC088124]|uniref:hypothetical protein n=1 Tax=Streptomyces sp. NPDC088124 TaxID=3154654 RepID=UPI003441D27E
MKNRNRTAAAAGMTAALLLILAPQALANWSSSISSGGVGFESRRWEDELYSRIEFTDCDLGSLHGGSNSVDVQMREDIPASPDDSYDNKTFTACFSGGTSKGEWTDLGSGMKDMYFQLMKVGGSTVNGNTVDVETVFVDTTKA